MVLKRLIAWAQREQQGFGERAERSRKMSPGQRVRLESHGRYPLLNGRTGTLVRRRRVANLRPGWLVDLDQPFGGVHRTTVADTAVVPLDR